MKHSNATRRSFRNAIDALEPRRLMATFAVTNAADTGTGSLRWAITSANATTAADVISFNLPSGSRTISPTSALPMITAPLTVDATTQPGYAGTPLITLDGVNAPTAGAGFSINVNDVLIRGMAIGNFKSNNGAGVLVGAAGLRGTVRDCYLGVAADGLTAMPNYDGFRSFAPAAQMLYSKSAGNQRFGAWLSGEGNKVFNSTIGLAPANNAAMGNGSAGVYIDHSDYCTVQDSVIASNEGDGITVDTQSANAIIERNIIGMTPNRTALRSNGTAGIRFQVDSSGSITDNRIATSDLYGVFIHNCDNITIEANNIGFGANTSNDFGGTAGVLLSASNYCTVRMNQIGHFDIGVSVYGSHQNSIRGNGIGSLLDNIVPVANGVGVKVEYGEDNDIGTDAEPNVISRNTAAGVHVVSGSRNAILGNRFRDNGGLDIDLGSTGVTQNDANDADTGANGLQNTIAEVYGAYNAPANPNQTTISFRAVNGNTGSGTYRVDFYRSSRVKDAFDTGEGTAHIGSRNITFTAGPTEVLFYENVSLETDGTLITATMTELVNGVPTDTSEFSKVMRVQGAPRVLGSSFEFEQRHELKFNFSRSVVGSITTNDISVRNLATNQTYTPNTVGFDGNDAPYWYFNAQLPDGNYRATLNLAGVSSSVPIGPAGNVSMNAVGPNTIDFHVLAGDANRDKKVNFDDLLILASNYNTTGKSFIQGNFNYTANGAANFDDLLILAANYNKALPAAAAPAPLSLNGGGTDDDSTGSDVLA